ncbi:hypothetical protein V6N11_017010 [Hibiscus sabdariffa]|uniref:HNH nuclease domain-containing protein n=1 Tax=Hibiscus sabdariffa TaxID=183260 RepID=A0ABR2TX24_9ROSI
MFKFLGSTPGKHHFPSSLKKGRKFNARASLSVSDEGIYGDEDYDSELEVDELACFRGLVLDISYRPINVVCWKRAICLEFMEKADVLEYYDQTVNSPSGPFNIPAVLRIPHLLQVVKRRRISANLSRKSVLFRDKFTYLVSVELKNNYLLLPELLSADVSFVNGYCRTRDNLTIDHVLPVARGGEWTWENLVTACAKCNSKKGRKTPEEANMTLIKVPKAPKDYDILAIPLTSAAITMLRMRNGTPEEWHQYLSLSMEP